MFGVSHPRGVDVTVVQNPTTSLADDIVTRRAIAAAREINMIMLHATVVTMAAGAAMLAGLAAAHAHSVGFGRTIRSRISPARTCA